jgi:hypothetical protein
MALRLLHQVGHNAKWNIDSFESDACGDGLILSPLHQPIDAIARMSASTLGTSLFDPQFYLPSSQKPKLLQYDFFPENLDGGFKTSTLGSNAAEIANKCIAYQRARGFRQVVVPIRFVDQMLSDYVDRQRRFSVDAFVEAANGTSLCLTLALTSAMIQDRGFRIKLLNWATSYPAVERLYVVCQHPRETKQIQEPEFLLACHRFFTEILDCGLQLTVGYLNSENVLFSVFDDIELTIGAFENTRMFTIDKFLVSEDERRGPKARIYLPGLMNWVQFEDAKNIRSKVPSVWRTIHTDTPYSEEAFGLGVDPAFNQPHLYKHYFQCADDEFRELKKLDCVDRLGRLKARVRKASEAYASIARAGLELERHGRGGHLRAWAEYLDAL